MRPRASLRVQHGSVPRAVVTLHAPMILGCAAIKTIRLAHSSADRAMPLLGLSYQVAMALALPPVVTLCVVYHSATTLAMDMW